MKTLFRRRSLAGDDEHGRSAADLPRRPIIRPPAPLSAYSWAGPYLGGNLGYEWGEVSNNPTRPSGFAGGVEAGYNWQTRPFRLRRRDGYRAVRRQRHVRAVEILQSLVRHVAGPRRLHRQQLPDLRHRRRRLRRAAGRNLRSDRKPYRYRLDRRRRHRGRLHAALVGQGGISVPRSRHQHFSLTGTSNGLTTSLFRMGVNYHF